MIERLLIFFLGKPKYRLFWEKSTRPNGWTCFPANWVAHNTGFFKGKIGSKHVLAIIIFICSCCASVKQQPCEYKDGDHYFTEDYHAHIEHKKTKKDNTKKEIGVLAIIVIGFVVSFNN